MTHIELYCIPHPREGTSNEVAVNVYAVACELGSLHRTGTILVEHSHILVPLEAAGSPTQILRHIHAFRRGLWVPL